MSSEQSYLIGVMSDTHDQVSNLVRVIDFLNESDVEAVIHCGDWVSPFTLIHYAKLKAPLFGVFGNNDGDKFRHITYSQRYGVDVVYDDQLLVLTRHEKKIVVYHGDYKEIVDALVKCGDYDVVCHGHNHRAAVERYGKVLSINPGTLVDFTNEEFQGSSFCVYDAQAHDARILWVKDLPMPLAFGR